MKELAKKYLDLIKGSYQGLNLTRILDEEEFYLKQIQDSLIPFEESVQVIALAEKLQMIDVGFGGGFPALPLSKKFPNKKIIGFDSRAKKVVAVSEIAKLLGLNNLKVFHNRIEEIEIDRDSLITFKAVGKIKDMLKLININAKNQAYVVFYKGPSLATEEQGFEHVPGWKLLEDFSLQLGENQRRILLYSNVPRGTASKKIVKSLVKVSSLNLE